MYGGFPMTISKPPSVNTSWNSSSHENDLPLTILLSLINEFPHLIFLSKLGSLKPCLTPEDVANFINNDNLVISTDSSLTSTP